MSTFGVQSLGMFYGWMPYDGFSPLGSYIPFQNSLMFSSKAYGNINPDTNFFFYPFATDFYLPAQYNFRKNYESSELSDDKLEVTKSPETSSVSTMKANSITDKRDAVSADEEKAKLTENDKSTVKFAADFTESNQNSVGRKVPKHYKANKVSSIRVGDMWNGHRVTSTYGRRKRPFHRASSNHKGVDLAYHNNEPFKSLSGGKVVKVVKSGKGYGNYIDVKDEKGTVHRYAHANRVLVKVGDRVSVGTVLGKAGASGNATGPHLHYERIEYGVKVNPAKTDNFSLMA